MKDVEILINGIKTIITIDCPHKMSEDRFKELAIQRYLTILKHDLYKENNLPNPILR